MKLNSSNLNSIIETNTFVTNNKVSLICEKSHKIYACPTFLQMEENKRLESIKRLKLCINFLNSNHQAENCKFGSCKKCSSKHNTLLHLGNKNIPVVASSSSSDIPPEMFSKQSLSGVVASGNQILLSTIQIIIDDSQGNPYNCRILLDSGSQSNFITANFANLLRLEKSEINMTVIGLTKVVFTIKFKTQIKIHSRQNAFSAKLSCLIVPHISDSVPNMSFDSSLLKIPQNLKLEDPDFNTTKPIDLLIGSDLFRQVLSVNSEDEIWVGDCR